MTFEEQLLLQLQSPLPGITAHREMIPDVKDAARRLGPPPAEAKRSAVVVPLVLRQGALPEVMFTLRSESMRSHKGQISFPGGRLDAFESPVEAALRELEEETGVGNHDVRILGELTDIYIPPSNSGVTPFVAVLNKPSEYIISEEEVEEIFHIPLEIFIDPRTLKRGPRTFFGTTVQVPYWDIHADVPLWGATAMILNELVWLVRKTIQ